MENYKYLRIYETYSIKLAEMKEKIEKSILNQQDNFSKLSSAAETSSKQLDTRDHLHKD